jgi:membrane-associated phospholipid phosphatase
MRDENKKIIKSIICLCYLALAIGLEFVYRKPLFDESLDIEKNIQKQYEGQPSMQSFLNVITKFGQSYATIPFMGLASVFLSINKSYQFLSVIVIASYMTNVLKISYANPRPFWVENGPAPKGCESGFGNPSGHAFTSVAVYLSLWHILTDFNYFKEKLLIRLTLLIPALGLIGIIIFSRIFLGVHGINQVLYGGSLGFFVYYLYYHVIAFHEWKDSEFLDIFRKKKYHFIFTTLYLSFLIVGIIVYCAVDNDISIAEYGSFLNSIDCAKDDYRRFNADGFYQILNILLLIGAHLGVVIYVWLVDKKFQDKDQYINNLWNSTTFKQKIMQWIFLLISAFPFLLAFIISGSASLEIIFTFKAAVPYFFSMFFIYGFGMYTIVYCGYGNPEIYKKTVSKCNSAVIVYNSINNHDGSAL